MRQNPKTFKLQKQNKIQVNSHAFPDHWLPAMLRLQSPKLKRLISGCNVSHTPMHSSLNNAAKHPRNFLHVATSLLKTLGFSSCQLGLWGCSVLDILELFGMLRIAFDFNSSNILNSENIHNSGNSLDLIDISLTPRNTLYLKKYSS